METQKKQVAEQAGQERVNPSHSRQATLDGVFLPPLPKVRSSEGHIFDWDRSKIIAQIERETKLVENFYGYAGATPEQAVEIAQEVEERIRKLGLRSLSGPLIREIVNMTFLEKGMVQYRNVCTRVGTPVFDAHLIDVGRGFEAHDNANLQENAETSHKKKADKISKEQYLLQLPPELADRHLAGDLHIHDLEYFGTRPFCLDGSMVVPVRTAGRHLTTRLDELPFEDGDAYLPADLAVLTPQGYRAVLKVTRRPVEEGELLSIHTATGRSLLVTKEHRVPVQVDGTMQIKKAGEVRESDRLYGFGETQALRGDSIDTIDLVRELSTSVPAELQETIFVRGARPIFDRLSGVEGSYAGISRALGIEHRKEWFSRGIMPLQVFAKLCDRYDIADYGDLTVGVAGSEHDLPAVLPVTPALCRLLGFFVSEGNYDVVPGSTYNLAITENHQSEAIIADVGTALGGYATLSGGTPDVTEIRGVRVEHDRAMQVYFGGKLGYLLFRYVFAVPEGAAKKRLPWIVWHLDDKRLKEFLSALFTGDGSAYYRPEKSDCIVNYTTVSASLRQELSLLLSSLGMHPQVVELYADDDRTTLYRLQINGSANIRIFAKWARFLDDRQEHIDRFCTEVKPIAHTPRGDEVVAVAGAAPSGKYVYDLFLDGDGTEESHTFFASDGLLVHNCQDWDLRYFFYYGLMPDGNGTKASVAGPAKRAEVAILHAVKALGSAQTNFAGGQGYYNFLTFLAPYFEGMEYDEMKQLMQMFVYEMTQMMVARGGQLVFSSVQLSPGVPTIWKDKPCVYKGKVWDGTQAPLRTYGEFEREVRLLFKALMEVMLEGDYWGKPFSFPKPEISIEPDFMEEDEEFNRQHPDLPTYRDLYLLTFELASKFGTPYYDNQLPPYRGAGKGISCYQCLPGDELVPVVDTDGLMQVRRLDELFALARRNGRQVDHTGTEFAPLPWKVPSVDFTTLEAAPREFLGVMRKRYTGKILSVRLASGRRIRVTPDHPVYLLKDGAYVKAKAADLQAGTYLPVLKNAGKGRIPLESIDLGALLEPFVGGGIVISEDTVTIRHAKRPGVPRSLRVTPALARFLGYYLAEGCSDHCGRRYSVRLSFGKKEQALIEDAVACIREIGFEPHLSEEKTAVNVVVNSKLLFTIMEALGAGKDAQSKSVPDVLFNVQAERIGDYLGAAFAGDGNVDVQEREQNGRRQRAAGIRMKLVSKDAVQRLVLLAGEIGVQMNYAEWSGNVTHPRTGEPYPITTYTCRITAQDQIERFAAATGFGTDAVNPERRATGGLFSRLPIGASGIDYDDLKYSSQYRSSEYASACTSLITDPAVQQAQIQADVHPLAVAEVVDEDYDGYVYDLVEVEGTHSFANALGIVTGNCCAYQFSSTFEKDASFEDKLYFKDGKHFSMGSWQVVSINCPRAAYRAEGDDARLFAELKALMDVAVKVFQIKRRWMETIRTNGRMPFAMQRPKDPNTGERGAVAVDLDSLVYTIGVIGVNEMVQHHTGQQLHESKRAFKLAVRAMTEMELHAREISEKTGMTIALARTPAETTAQRFAVADMLDDRFRDAALKVMKGDTETAVTECGNTRDLPVYYTNGTHVAPGADVPLTKRMEIEHVFFPIVDGGNIFHIWLGEARPDPRGLYDMAMNLCRKTQIGYFAFTRDLTVSLKRFREYHSEQPTKGRTGA